MWKHEFSGAGKPVVALLNLVFLAILLGFCPVMAQLPQSHSPQPEPQQAPKSPDKQQQSVRAWFDASEVTLGPGDSIYLSVFEEEALSKEWRIAESGELYLPMIGRVVAAGKSIAALETELKERYKTYLTNPQLTVSLSQLRSRPVTVSGSVRAPGIYQIEGGATLYQALALAGGVEAGGSMVTLTRRKSSGEIPLSGSRWTKDGQEMAVDLNLRDVLRGYGADASLEVRPYDVIHVSASRDRLVYVGGEVNIPGTIQLVNSTSIYITQALAMAGGNKTSSKLSKTYVFNRGDGSQPPKMTIVNISKILAGKAEDYKLSDGDYFIVPYKGLIPTMSAVGSFTSPAAAVAMVLGIW